MSVQDQAQVELCTCEPFLSNMKAISFESIANKTKYVKTHVSERLYVFRCKYCSVKMRCQCVDDEGEAWSTTKQGEHVHPPLPEGKVRKVEPISYCLKLAVRRALDAGQSGAALRASVNEYFGYELRPDMTRYHENKLRGRKESKQWAMVPGLVDELRKLGTWSTVVIDKGSVVRVYVEFKTISFMQSDAFLRMIFLDGCHCSDQKHSTLCIACTITADHVTIPLAFVLGQGENKENYTLLLRQMRRTWRSGTVILSDQSQALLSAAEDSLRDLRYYHKPCAFHVLKHLPVTRTRFYEMLKSDNSQLFNQRLSALISKFPECEDRLIEIANELAYMGKNYHNTFGLVSDSPVESVNAAIAEYRQKEPLDLITGFIEWSNKQVDFQLEKLQSTYCQSYINTMEFRGKMKDAMSIKINADKTWLITEQLRKGETTYLVRYEDSVPICSCGGYSRDGMPCRHLIALNSRGMTTLPVPWACHKSDVIRCALERKEIFIDRAEIAPSDVLPPESKPRPGRRPYRRIRSISEHQFNSRKRRYQCTICHAEGHTSRTHEAWVRLQRDRTTRATTSAKTGPTKPQRAIAKAVFGPLPRKEQEQEPTVA